MKTIARLVSGLLMSILVLGCKPDRPALTEVKGTVTYNNRPLYGVVVSFIPDSTKGTQGPRATGVTNDQGEFTLTADTNEPGAAPGWYRVTVADPNVRSGREEDPFNTQPGGTRSKPKQVNPPLPPLVADATRSPLQVEVKPGQKVELKIP